MRGVLLAAAVAVSLGSALAPCEANPAGRPLLSDMKNENDVEVQYIRDALMAYYGVNKHWPTTFEELDLFADQYQLPHHKAAFAKLNYYVQNQGSATVAVFEFVMNGSPVKGAFAIANFTVQGTKQP